MTTFKSLADIRREYGELSLSEESAHDDPIVQFKLWFEDVLEHGKTDPTAMVLSTVDEKGFPDSRIVLLKNIDEGAFVFYTNYHSAKAQQIEHQPYAALNFYWPEMARQVRIRGSVKRVADKESDDYFSSRPLYSKLSAIISPQSHAINNRAELERKLNELIQLHGQEPVLRPEFWGGYSVFPEEIEFWQGRDNRLHDRIHYYRQSGNWQHRRLAP